MDNEQLTMKFVETLRATFIWFDMVLNCLMWLEFVVETLRATFVVSRATFVVSQNFAYIEIQNFVSVH